MSPLPFRCSSVVVSASSVTLWDCCICSNVGGSLSLVMYGSIGCGKGGVFDVVGDNSK